MPKPVPLGHAARDKIERILGHREPIRLRMMLVLTRAAIINPFQSANTFVQFWGVPRAGPVSRARPTATFRLFTARHVLEAVQYIVPFEILHRSRRSGRKKFAVVRSRGDR